MRVFVAVVLTAALTGVVNASEFPPVLLTQSPSSIQISNGFVNAVFSLSPPHLSSLGGDFNGTGTYTELLTNGGFTLEREDADGTVHSSADADTPAANATVQFYSTSSASFIVSGVSECGPGCGVITEQWTVRLDAGSRGLWLNTTGSTSASVSTKAIRHSWFSLARSVTGLYERGVSQMMGAPGGFDFFGSASPVSRVFVLGNRPPVGGGSGGRSLDLLRYGSSLSMQTVLMSSASGDPYWGGMQEVLAGEYSPLDAWNKGWQGLPVHTIPAHTTWSTSTQAFPNSGDFPVSTVTMYPSSPSAAADAQAVLTGVMPGSVGCLVTYFDDTKGQVATTPARPSRGYSGNYNFFDPDNYVGFSAVLAVGDAYLSEQVRLVLEHSGSYLTAAGQLPHHFVGNVPTYLALSGAEQTGPNIFWTLTVLYYARTTGNTTWLESYMPTLRHSQSFLLSFYDPAEALLKVPGSLMIDTFRRTNYTADSNAMFTIYLSEFALAEEYFGNSTGAAALRAMAADITTALNDKLWAASKDHFVTQLNPDGSIADFVDYDANLIAVAAGVPTDPAAVLKRVDGGRCTHGRCTFVSEKYYGPSDCFKNNVGDSWCSMGRIGLFDAFARKKVGDLSTFSSVLLDPLQADLIANTFLHERYGCDGQQQMNRTQAYFEYPAVVTTMLHGVKYGIEPRLASVTVAPLDPAPFEYGFGNVHVSFSPTAVSLSLPTDGKPKNVTIGSLVPNAAFDVAVTGPSGSRSGCKASPSTVTSSSAGVVSFTAAFADCVVLVKRA